MYSFVEICCLLERTTDSEAMDADISFSNPRGITVKKYHKMYKMINDAYLALLS